LHVATKERLLPGDGDIDLLEMCRALPADTPVAMEIPMTKLSQTISAIERARRAAEATRQTLRRARAAATGS
jgi:sugar phosphate isomerase/epimerase